MNRQTTASVKKRILFSLAATAGFFVLLELLLFACGVRPRARYEDPYVGFASYLPLFVEQEDDAGHRMVTAPNKLRWFNPQAFPKEKPSGAYRVFCLGGSTTYGRPYDDRTSFCAWLRELLPEADRSRCWEVINAGGISYASYRVVKVMEELVECDPDLFVIYSGHNEFLEARTYGRLRRVPSSIRGLGAVLSRTRTYAAVAWLMEGVGLKRKPSERQTDRPLLPAEVKTLLDTAIGPEVYHRDDQLRQEILAHFELNLNRMIDVARSAGAEVILVAPASNLRDCSPFRSEHRTGLGAEELSQWQEMYRRGQEALDAGQLDEALRALDRAAAIDDRYADLLYLRGRVLFELKRYAEAKAAFLKARDEDVCPLRAPTALGEIIAKVASERDVPQVDFVTWAERRSAHGIPGEELFLDHVHLTIDGHRHLALLLLEELAARKVLQLGPAWSEGAIREVAARIEARVDRAMQAAALRNLSKVLSWAGKTEEADRLALVAVELSADDAEAQYQAANALLRQGKLDQALARYQRALQLDPTSAATHYGLGLAWTEKANLSEAIRHYQRALELDPDFPDAHYNLGLLLEDRGDLDRAAFHYRQAIRNNPQDHAACNNLGVVLAKQGRLPDARTQFERALQINPRFADAHSNLGRVFAEQGDLLAAVDHYRQALRYEPGHVDAGRHLKAALAGSRSGPAEPSGSQP